MKCYNSKLVHSTYLKCKYFITRHRKIFLDKKPSKYTFHYLKTLKVNLNLKI